MLPHVAWCYPKLIEAELEELGNGLDSGEFTSVDLVNVYVRVPFSRHNLSKNRRILRESMRSTAPSMW